MSRSDAPKKVVGLLKKQDGKLLFLPSNNKGKSIGYRINRISGGKEGDIVAAELLPQTGSWQEVNVTKVLGQENTPGILTTISLYEQNLSEVFSQAALKQAESLTVPKLDDREDLRNIPLVTVDGKDSRDFDDAIYAESTPDDGKHLIVAIADVSWYVRPGDALDQEALRRGNSTYLPDRAVPMLPEELSNGLCSLKPHEDRACLAVHLWIDKDGNLTEKKITRAMIKSVARLTYEQLQAARDGKPDDVTRPLMDTVVNPLYEAYDILKSASQARGTLDLSSPEYVTEIDENGRAINLVLADDSASHDVIAEFMILANTATDQLLEEKGEIGIHRIHAQPPEKKVSALRAYLRPFGLSFPTGPITSPRDFKDLVKKATQMPEGREIIQSVARTMSKAEYSTANIGHFGLALRIYGHFTSPIRRYADLLQHRQLVKAFNLGAGGMTAEQATQLDEMVEHINGTERLSVRAERAANERYAADYLSTQIGKEFQGSITGVMGSGVFIRLDKAGVEGFLPVRNFGDDYYNYNDSTKTLTGSHNGKVYKSGDKMTVRVKSADGFTGSVNFVAANDNTAQKSVHQNRPRHPSRKNNGPR